MEVPPRLLLCGVDGSSGGGDDMIAAAAVAPDDGGIVCHVSFRSCWRLAVTIQPEVGKN